jgi:non-canonical (house-cleaning) NTP pyrophosphatase
MITLVVASTNPVKIQAAVSGYQRLFPGSELKAVAVSVPSDVAHQPVSDEETLRGALNRSAHADDIVFSCSNSKQDNGAVGLLTDNVIDRAQLYEQAVILALIPFKNERLYASQGEG